MSRIRLALIALCVTSFLGLAGLAFQYWNQRQQLEQTAFTSATRQAAAAAAEINDVFGGVMAIADRLAADLTEGRQDYTGVAQRLRAEMEARPDLDGLAVTFEPYVYDPDLRLYQHYVYKTNGGFDALDGATYDYTRPPSDEPGAPQTGWYYYPLRDGPLWNEPFLATGAGKVLIEYGVPFYRTEPDLSELIPAGVVTIDYSLQDMRDLMSVMALGATGYGFTISASGVFLAHPIDELVARSTIFDLAVSIDDQPLAAAAQRALAGEEFVIERVDPVTEQASWMFFEPIPMTNWALGVVLNQAEYIPNVRTTVQDQIVLALAGGLFALSVAAFALRVETGTNRSVWGVSIAFSVLCAGVIALTWYLMASIREQTGIIMTSRATVERYLESYTHSLLPDDEPPLTVPTGVLVQALYFPNPTSVTVNGYIWQRYDSSLPDDLIQGFTLPQTIGEEIIIEEVLVEEQGDEEVVIWYIGLTLRQSFDTLQFPFDRRDITLRIAPADLSRNIILTPDLDSYSLIAPRLLPGVDSGVAINNWSLEASNFSYQTPAYTTSFGLRSRSAFRNMPELTFTIHSRRNFLGPFIANLLPGLVAAGMMFAFLLRDRKPDEREEIVTTLNYSAALFFVIAVSHAALRDNIAAVGLTYMEHLYILLYISIVVVAANTFLLVKRPDLALVQYRSNLIPRLFYWPVITGMLLISTLLTFVFH